MHSQIISCEESSIAILFSEAKCFKISKVVRSCDYVRLFFAVYFKINVEISKCPSRATFTYQEF